jgi:hypothetical protein
MEGDDTLPEVPAADDALPMAPMDEYTDFWSMDSTLMITLEMPSQHLQWISDCGAEKNYYKNDVYFPVTMTLNLNGVDYVAYEVGMRMKGNTYSRGVIAEEGLLVAPFSFKLSFDEVYNDDFYDEFGLKKVWTSVNPDYQARKDRTLFGMEKVDFKWNRSNDPSLITQAFSFAKFAEWTPLGLTPHSTLTAMRLRTEKQTLNLGVYIANEAIDKILMRRFFNKAEAAGDLYKVLWPADFNLINRAGAEVLIDNGEGYEVNPEIIGVEDTWNYYHPVYDLKTNKKSSDHEALIRFIDTLQTAGTLELEDRKTALESVVDIPSFLGYAATSYLLGNPDDTRWNANNTYLYFHPVTQVAYILPYDFDWSFGVTWEAGLTTSMGFLTPIDNWSPLGHAVHNPLYWYTMLSEDGELHYSDRYPLVPEYQDDYLSLVSSLAGSEAFSVNAYQTMFYTYRGHYETNGQDIETHSSFVGIDVFTTYRTALMDTLAGFYA